MSAHVNEIHYNKTEHNYQPAYALQYNENQVEKLMPQQKQKIQIQSADLNHDDRMSNKKSRKDSQILGCQNNQKQDKGTEKSQYSTYKKHAKNQGQSQFGRLKSKINFILMAGRNTDQEASVSYYNESRKSSLGDRSLSSASIQSNKRFVSRFDQEQQANKKNGDNLDKKCVQFQKQKGKNSIEENQFLAESFAEKKNTLGTNKYIFFGQPDCKQASNTQDVDKKLILSHPRAQQKKRKNSMKIKLSHTKEEQLNKIYQKEEQIQSPKSKAEGKVIFEDEEHQPQVYDIEGSYKVKDANTNPLNLNQTPLLRQESDRNNSRFQDKSLSSFKYQNQKIMVRSLDKSQQSQAKGTIRNELQKSGHVAEEVLAKINKQEESFKKSLMSVNSRIDDLTDRYEHLSTERERTIEATRNLRSSQQNNYESIHRGNVFELQRFSSAAQNRIDLEEQNISPSNYQSKRREAQTLNLKPRLHIAKKRNSEYELINIQSPERDKPIYPQIKNIPSAQKRKSYMEYVGLKHGLQHQLNNNDDVPVKKIDFKVQLKRRLKTQAEEKQSKKFTAILKKRQAALAKKVREQLRNVPKYLFTDNSATMSKHSSIQEIQKDQLPSSPFFSHYTKLNPKNKQALKSQFPSIDSSHQPFSIRQPKTTGHDYDNPHSLRKNPHNADLTRRNRLKSENSSYSDKVSFEAQSITFTNPALQVGKVSYRNLSHYWKDVKNKNTSAKEKYDRLKKLLEQI